MLALGRMVFRWRLLLLLLLLLFVVVVRFVVEEVTQRVRPASLSYLVKATVGLPCS